MRHLVALAAAAAIIALTLGASPAAADDSTMICISEDTGNHGQARCVDRGHEGTVNNLAQLGYTGLPGNIFGCHGDQWPDISVNGWNDCVSSYSYIVQPNDCVQMWSGNSGSGRLIMSVTVRPGNSTKSSVITSMGSDNDTATSILEGYWTGSASSGHCVWR